MDTFELVGLSPDDAAQAREALKCRHHPSYFEFKTSGSVTLSDDEILQRTIRHLNVLIIACGLPSEAEDINLTTARGWFGADVQPSDLPLIETVVKSTNSRAAVQTGKNDPSRREGMFGRLANASVINRLAAILCDHANASQLFEARPVETYKMSDKPVFSVSNPCTNPPSDRI